MRNRIRLINVQTGTPSGVLLCVLRYGYLCYGGIFIRHSFFLTLHIRTMSGESSQKNDSIASVLRAWGQHIVVVVFGLLPLLFIPTANAPFEYTKILIVIGALLVALVLYSLSVLRSGIVQVGISYPLCALWALSVIAMVSALLSGDFRDAFIGDFFSIHSALFTILLTAVPTVWMILRPSKTAVMRMYMLLALSTIVLVAYHVLRLFFGADFFSFGVFTSETSTPVGTWNDLALLLGLVVILSLVVLEQLALTKMGRVLFGVVTFLSLVMLSVINFFTVWLVLGLSSVALIVYTLGKERFSGKQLPLLAGRGVSSSFGISLLVFGISVLFIIGGSTIGGWIAERTGVNYIEVRPSLEATGNIARHVYAENAVLGIGPNKFVDAWRLYKEDAINTTYFWNADFNGGNGYITTFFVTTGVLGGVAWILFLITYVVAGMRRLLRSTEGDKLWYFVGVSSFVSALYIWGMSVLYVPGAVILLIGALCTGVSLYAFSILGGVQPREIAVGGDRRIGFILTLITMFVIIGSVVLLYMAVRHYSAVYTFNKSIQSMREGTPVAELEQQVMDAFSLAASDVFARRIAEYQLGRLNALAQLPEPTEAQVEEFNTTMVNGVRFAQEAVRLDGKEPANWAVLAGIYNVLASLNVEGALDRVREALDQYRTLNPKNPLPHLESAVVEARVGNYDLARTHIDLALKIKPNSIEAYQLLAQLAVIQGNVDEAVSSTQAAISLEPRNPILYYHLGVLESSRENTETAIAAFQKAIELDTNYANAHYLLALAYDLTGDSAAAKTHLERVLELNPGNADVEQLIRTIDEEGSLAGLRGGISQSVDEPAAQVDESGNVHATNDPDTSLVAPVNTTPAE